MILLHGQRTTAAQGQKTSRGRTAVVLGVALYFFRWRGSAHQFLRRHRAALGKIPVAVFGGKLDPDHLRFSDNNPAIRQMGAVDPRDWEAVGTWADELAEEPTGGAA